MKVSLEKAHLPQKYSRMTEGEKKKARLHSLTSWFDPDKPDQLCSNVDNFVAAHYLWCEYYFKADPYNRGTYYYDDPICKYDMVRMAMGNSLIDTEPSKAVVHAPRRLGKTKTLVEELCSLLAITRPFTEILISEANSERTIEEIVKIKSQIENNKQIHADFGAEGVLWPRKHASASRWKTNRLEFLHLPKCAIIGHSINSAQRGRGPIFGIIDDPEGDEDSYNRKWRKDYFSKLFNVYLKMFNAGGKILWIGTVIHGQSCLALALQGLAQLDDEEGSLDPRFDDWNKRRISMIEEGPDGELFSQQPQRLTVEGFETRKKAQGVASVMAELQGMPITPGQSAFDFDPYRHGYMRCKNDSGGEDYFFDLATGERQPWNEWLDTLVVFAAGDLADGVSPDSDPGALVFIGINPKGIRYVLDVFNKRCYSGDLIKTAYDMATKWNCKTLAWEKTGMQVAIVRQARRHMEQLRAEGVRVPRLVELSNNKRDKVSRILTLIPYFSSDQIRFMRFGKVVDGKGCAHDSTTIANMRYHRDLSCQVVEFTDEGLRGHDDAIDALEMAIRISTGAKGIAPPVEEHPTDQLIKDWEEVGINFNSHSIPVNNWSPEMRKELITTQFSEEDYWETCNG